METFLIESAAGAVAGVACVLVGHPFDTLKVNMQASRGRFRSALECAGILLQQGGVRSLYRGAAGPLLGIPAETSVNYAVYETTKSTLLKRALLAAEEASNKQKNSPSSKCSSTMNVSEQFLFSRQAGDNLPPRTLQQHTVIAGSLAGMALTVPLTPTELLKCRAQTLQGAHRTLLGAARHVIAVDGFRGLFRGFVPTFVREVSGNAFYFHVYESIHRYMRGSSQSAGSANSLLQDSIATVIGGGLAGSSFWLLTLPIDTIKTRVQLEEGRGRGVWYHCSEIYKVGGIRAFYAGLGPTMIRAFPTNAAQFAAWEATRQLLRSMMKHDDRNTS